MNRKMCIGAQEGRKRVRETLKKARQDAGLTQKQVAEKVGLKVGSYQQIELGKRIGRIETWDKLEDLFSIHQRILREISTNLRDTGENPETY